MKLHTLKPAEGSTKSGKRIARGQGSGRGGTSTRGHKGAQSRSGYSRKTGFEGGQMPLQRRIPKFGFRFPDRILTTVLFPIPFLPSNPTTSPLLTTISTSLTTFL